MPNYFDPARAVGSLGALSATGHPSAEYEAPTTFDVDRERAREILESGARRGSNRLGVEAMELLDAYGIPTPRGDVVSSPVDAVAVAEDIDDNVVMKIVSPDILHKSDIGGVEVASTTRTFATPTRTSSPAQELPARRQHPRRAGPRDGDLDDGVETIVGMNRDPQFGPLMMFGLGGIFVEVLEDTLPRRARQRDRGGRDAR